MNNEILITGGSGFLGSKLVESFVKKGHKVSILKRAGTDLSRIEPFLDKISVYDVDELDTLFGRISVDTIIHTATSYGRQGEGLSDVYGTNVLFPLKLIEYAVNSGVRFFINTDTMLPSLTNAYSLSKANFYQIGKYLSSNRKIKFINLKIEHFYGVGEDRSKFISYVIKQCLSTSASLQLTPGEQLRDFIYIDDVVSAYEAVLAKAKSDDSEIFLQEFNVGSGRLISIKDLVKKIRDITGSIIELDFGALPYRENELMATDLNINPLIALGWKPKTCLDGGLKIMVEAIR